MSGLSLHLIDPDAVDYEQARLALMPEERDQADRFVFEKDRLKWTIYRATARQLLGDVLDIPPDQVAWQIGESGKPFVADPLIDFNLSHSGKLAALLISTVGPVGVDLEPLHRGKELLECASSFCHPDEIKALPDDSEERATQLIHLWTSKEALLKAHGTGLGFPPTQLKVVGDRGVAALEGIERFHLLRPSSSRLAGYTLAAAVALDQWQIDVNEPGHRIDT